MYIGFFHWYGVVAPVWLLTLFVNLQRALMQYFSVSLMLKTLFAHWRKDVAGYHGGISDRLMTFAWNQISRGIGFFIRTIVLILWLITEIVLLGASLSLFLLFMSWPLLIMAGFVLSAVMIF